MNELIYNTEEKLHVAGYAQTGNGVLTPFASDVSGRVLASQQQTLTISSAGLDIRPLDSTDSLSITVTELDIRNLFGATDSIQISGQSWEIDSNTQSVGILTTVYVLPKDMSKYRRNAFFVYNTSGVTVGADITLQISPVNSNAYYVDNGSTFSLLGGQKLILVPSIPLRYARVKITTLLAIASVTVVYMGVT